VIFKPTVIAGLWSISLEVHTDRRGSFARTFCEREFAAHGLPTHFVQCNLSYNICRGTLRGMHFQRPPAAEGKIVRCIRGAVFDVVIDLRPESDSYRQWTSFELTAENRECVYVPPGCAHGFQTLADETELFYHMSDFYKPELSSGVRWDDPAFGIQWPVPNPTLSEADRTYPDYAV
jgi:dTDP-4-dehydrorhamnose 3,5-epimerase